VTRITLIGERDFRGYVLRSDPCGPMQYESLGEEEPGAKQDENERDNPVAPPVK